MIIPKQIILSLVLGLSITVQTWTKPDATVSSKKVTVVFAPSESRKILSGFSQNAKDQLKHLYQEIAQIEYKSGRKTMHIHYLKEQADALKKFIKNQKLQVTTSAVGTDRSQNLAAMLVGAKGAKFSVDIPNQIESNEYSHATQRTHHLRISVTPTSPEIARELNIEHVHHHEYKKLYPGQKIKFWTSSASEKKYGVDHLELP